MAETPSLSGALLRRLMEEAPPGAVGRASGPGDMFAKDNYLEWVSALNRHSPTVMALEPLSSAVAGIHKLHERVGRARRGLARLMMYARHLESCPAAGDGDHCTCGLIGIMHEADAYIEGDGYEQEA